VQGAFDIAVVGSGFAGSLIAMIARRLGRSVVLLEKGKHPRFAIGESSTPIANLLLEELSNRYGLPRLRPLSKWGTWQQTYPHIACGLKRGFTFYHHEAGRAFSDDDSHQKQLLVAASPNDRIADTHWYRPDFDAFLMNEARQLGAVYLDEVDLWGVNTELKRPIIQGRHRGQPLEIHAEFIIDATGPRGFMHRALNLPEVPVPHLPHTEAFYSHFTGVKRWEDLHRGENNGHQSIEPPYPPDDAALHHVFDGGWMWVLRFNNGITSAGFACRQGLFDLTRGEKSWQDWLEKFPSVREQFADAKATLPFVHAKKISFLSGEAAGANWALLPSAAGFIDPLLSTGFPLTLLGVERIARMIETKWGRADFAMELSNYSMQTTMEIVSAGRLVAALYASMHDFDLFRALTQLYFAAACYTEAARRLGKPELVGGTFLLGEHPIFAERCRSCAEAALRHPTGARRDLLLRAIQQAIQPVDIAGLGQDRKHWYPALADDLFANAEKLRATPGEIQSMLERCGFNSTDRQRAEKVTLVF
jgi:FADH2 O2-dependent halogenase